MRKDNSSWLRAAVMIRTVWFILAMIPVLFCFAVAAFLSLLLLTPHMLYMRLRRRGLKTANRGSTLAET